MNRRTVVVVDDLAELRQVLRLVLEHGGPFRVVGEGRNTGEAVALAAEHHPDLLLMDVEMPGGTTGWEALPAIREVAPETSVVILSGSSAEQHPSEWRALAAAVLEKGMPPKELNAALVEVLGIAVPEPRQGADVLATADDALVSAGVRIERQQRDLARSSAELEAFAAVAGHDLAQPLQVAYGYLEMLRADHGADLDPTAQEWLDAAVASLERMRVLVQGILGFARAGTRPPQPEEVDLTAAVDAAVDGLAPELAERAPEIRRSDLPLVRADGDHLVTVLRVLLDNAVRYSRTTAGAAAIDVTAEATPAEWVVAVADRGPGVPAELRDHAFDAFRRGPGATGGGAGLGLAVARRLVEAQGGRIWFDPPGTGGGTVVRFSLPRR